jgi:hypothetical protein
VRRIVEKHHGTVESSDGAWICRVRGLAWDRLANDHRAGSVAGDRKLGREDIVGGS